MERSSSLRSRFLLLASLPLMLTVSACDDGHRDSELEITHRKGFRVVYPVSASKSYKGNGCPNPIDGTCPVPPFPFDERQIVGRHQMYDRVFNVAFDGSEDAEMLCPESCDSLGSSWTGATEVKGAYEFGEPYAVVDHDGTRTGEVEVEVHADLNYGCVCE